MRTYLLRCVLGLSALLVVGLVACGETTTPTSPSGSSGTSGRGTLVVRLTDLPYNAVALHVTFADVSAHLSGAGGGWQNLLPIGAMRTCDLNQLVRGGSFDMVGADFPAGDYTQLRLTVLDAKLYFTGTRVAPMCGVGDDIGAPAAEFASVEIPSGEVKLNRPFSLEANGTTTIELDFDGDRSVKEMGNIGSATPELGRYRMTPVISVLRVVQS